VLFVLYKLLEMFLYDETCTYGPLDLWLEMYMYMYLHLHMYLQVFCAGRHVCIRMTGACVKPRNNEGAGLIFAVPSQGQTSSQGFRFGLTSGSCTRPEGLSCSSLNVSRDL
jgi:hypothetical protein